MIYKEFLADISFWVPWLLKSPVHITIKHQCFGRKPIFGKNFSQSTPWFSVQLLGDISLNAFQITSPMNRMVGSKIGVMLFFFNYYCLFLKKKRKHRKCINNMDQYSPQAIIAFLVKHIMIINLRPGEFQKNNRLRECQVNMQGG